ncbi:MAG: hypothetical protein EOO63_15885, partial [Hymenobacter sp.]
MDAVIRAAIWLMAALIALYPVCHAVHMRPTLNIVSLAAAANSKLLFRDFFFIVVVLVAASFGNILYSFTKDATRTWFKGLSVLACLYYLYVLIYGVSRFAELTEMKIPISADDLGDDLSFMAIAGAITLLAELAISLTESGESKA